MSISVERAIMELEMRKALCAVTNTHAQKAFDMAIEALRGKDPSGKCRFRDNENCNYGDEPRPCVYARKGGGEDE